jgi:hypothetical protein
MLGRQASRIDFCIIFILYFVAWLASPTSCGRRPYYTTKRPRLQGRDGTNGCCLGSFNLASHARKRPRPLPQWKGARRDAIALAGARTQAMNCQPSAIGARAGAARGQSLRSLQTIRRPSVWQQILERCTLTVDNHLLTCSSEHPGLDPGVVYSDVGHRTLYPGPCLAISDAAERPGCPGCRRPAFALGIRSLARPGLQPWA